MQKGNIVFKQRFEREEKRRHFFPPKRKGRIEIQPVFNPISYEKPIDLDIPGKHKVAWVDKKK
jgi:hypothetical protein